MGLLLWIGHVCQAKDVFGEWLELDSQHLDATFGRAPLGGVSNRVRFFGRRGHGYKSTKMDDQASKNLWLLKFVVQKLQSIVPSWLERGQGKRTGKPWGDGDFLAECRWSAGNHR